MVLALTVGLLLLTVLLLTVHLAVTDPADTLRSANCTLAGSWNGTNCYTAAHRMEIFAALYLDVFQPVVTFLPVLIGMLLGAPCSPRSSSAARTAWSGPSRSPRPAGWSPGSPCRWRPSR